MAYVKNLRTLSHLDKPNTLRVAVALKPKGEIEIDVDMPPDFMDCLYKIAQLAADKHEQEMRAQILADAAKELPK